ncbi:hypothetical protein ACNSZF_07025 [Burkholderia gladioli]
MNSLTSLWASREVLASGAATSVVLVALCLAISLPLAMLGYVLLREGRGPWRASCACWRT